VFHQDYDGKSEQESQSKCLELHLLEI